MYLPRSTDEMREKAAEFEAKFGMPQAFGCIDGTHMRIKRPICNSQEYLNYKQFFSLSVQAVCDFQGHFMDIDCRWPGSVHNAKIFANSSLNKKLSNGLLHVTYKGNGIQSFRPQVNSHQVDSPPSQFAPSRFAPKPI